MNKNRRNFIVVGAALGISGLGVFQILKYLNRGRFVGEKPIGFVSHLSGKCYFPPHFQVKAFSIQGETMSDGNVVPEQHDGMACFSGENGDLVLVRNHEISPGENLNVHANAPTYDPQCRGGVTVVRVNSNFEVIESYLALTGTAVNCSGGRTPWGTWLTCEEIFTVPLAQAKRPDEDSKLVSQKHGYVFEVDPSAGRNAPPRKLKPLGCFQHEAAAVDPDSGFVYLTEDRGDGCFYRFIPSVKNDLSAEGKLQALQVVADQSCRWLDVTDFDPETDSIRSTMQAQGATSFNRGEGIVFDGGHVYFTASAGGQSGMGQIFKLSNGHLDESQLELVYEAHDHNILLNPDQLTVNKWGDLIVCEDPGDGARSRIVGITAEKKIYLIAESVDSEWTGVCYSPDGNTLLVNLQDAGTTFALTGDWEKLRS